jgi:hypothetical protein
MELIVMKKETTEGRGVGASSPVMKTALGLDEKLRCPPEPAAPPPHAMAMTRTPSNVAKARIRLMSYSKVQRFSGGDSFYLPLSSKHQSEGKVAGYKKKKLNC